jgi:mannose-6-phosphate isomerase-like protein (cupin superfamily)
MKKFVLDDSTDLGRLFMSVFQPDCMPKHERRFQTFRFEQPELSGKKTKAITRLATTDVVMAAIQVLDEGGDAQLHLHAASDGFWMVLSGRVSFIGEDRVEREFGPLEGIMVPRGTPYAFKKVGGTPLMLLQVECLHGAAKSNAFKVIDPPETDTRLPQNERIDFYDARRD